MRWSSGSRPGALGWGYPAGAEHDPRAPWNEREEVEDCPVCGESNRDAPDHLYPCCSADCAARFEPFEPPAVVQGTPTGRHHDGFVVIGDDPPSRRPITQSESDSLRAFWDRFKGVRGER